jgi:prefoldin alpha subunit
MATEKKEIKLTGQQIAQNFEANRQRLQALNQRISQMMNVKREIQTGINALQELQKSQDIKFMIGSGIYVEAKVLDAKNVTVTLPEGILITQSYEKTLKDLNKRMNETDKLIQEIRKQQARTNQQTMLFQELMVKGQQIARQKKEK